MTISEQKNDFVPPGKEFFQRREALTKLKAEYYYDVTPREGVKVGTERVWWHKAASKCNISIETRIIYGKGGQPDMVRVWRVK